MMVTSDPEFHAYCKENFIMDDSIDNRPDDNDDGYFSKDNISVNEMEEVSDEWFNSHLMDQH